MTQEHSTTNEKERKPGQHLRAEERGAIAALKKLGYSNRAIAREIGCSPSTVGYELKRGTPNYSGRGRRPEYSAKRGAAVYRKNRSGCHRPKTIGRSSRFISWAINMIHVEDWSLDQCVGSARAGNLFPREEIPCTKTLYNWMWRGELALTMFDLPEALSRKRRRNPPVPKRLKGTSIDMRPPEANNRDIFGHWEADTVTGKKAKGEPAIFTLVERKTGFYIAIRIDSKTTNGVSMAMNKLKAEYGNMFSQVFKTITTDNGNEFADFSKYEELGTKIYFAHPYSAWERPVNERTNRCLRKFVPKGKSISLYSDDDILMYADMINSTPRKRLGYRTPEELFEEHLDQIYRID